MAAHKRTGIHEWRSIRTRIRPIFEDSAFLKALERASCHHLGPAATVILRVCARKNVMQKMCALTIFWLREPLTLQVDCCISHKHTSLHTHAHTQLGCWGAGYGPAFKQMAWMLRYQSP